jgi:hypothetical protein
MLRFKGYISNFTCASYYFLYVEFGDFYVNQFLAVQTIPVKLIEYLFYYTCILDLIFKYQTTMNAL